MRVGDAQNRTRHADVYIELTLHPDKEDHIILRAVDIKGDEIPGGKIAVFHLYEEEGPDKGKLIVGLYPNVNDELFETDDEGYINVR